MRGNERGVALILTLLVIGVLLILVLGFNRLVQKEIEAATRQKNALQALYMSKAGIEVAKLFLKEEKFFLSPEFFSEKEGGFFPSFPLKQLFPEGELKVILVDENSKININRLISPEGKVDNRRREQLERLFDLLQIDKEIIDAILDWIDPDEEKRLTGAEKEDYLQMGSSRLPSNAPLDTISELLLIKGIDGKIYGGREGKKGLKDYLTLFSDGYININSADFLMLQSLSPKIDEDLAQSIIRYRKERPFQKREELKEVIGMGEIYPEVAPLLTTKSSSLLIGSEGNYGKSKKRVEAVFKEKGTDLELVYWQED